MRPVADDLGARRFHVPDRIASRRDSLAFLNGLGCLTNRIGVVHSCDSVLF